MIECNKLGVEDYAWLDWKGDPLGIVLEFKSWPFNQMVNAQARTRPIGWDA